MQLKDDESRPSDRVVAGYANVSVSLVNQVRNEMEASGELNTVLSSRGEDGKVRNVKNLGRKSTPKAARATAAVGAAKRTVVHSPAGEAASIADETPPQSDAAGAEEPVTGGDANVAESDRPAAAESGTPESAGTSLPSGKLHQQVLSRCEELRQLLEGLAENSRRPRGPTRRALRRPG